MTEHEARQNLLDMLESFTAGSVCHLLAEVVRQSEEARLGGLDEAAEERVSEAEGALWVLGMGLMAVLHRG